MERELLFTDKLQELRETAKAQGNLITEDQLQEAFSELSFDEEQLAMVREYLAKHKIGIGKPVDTEENLTREEKNFLMIQNQNLRSMDCSHRYRQEISRNLILSLRLTYRVLLRRLSKASSNSATMKWQ